MGQGNPPQIPGLLRENEGQGDRTTSGGVGESGWDLGGDALRDCDPRPAPLRGGRHLWPGFLAVCVFFGVYSLKILSYFPPVGFAGNLSPLEKMHVLCRWLKQMEVSLLGCFLFVDVFGLI